MAPATHDLHLPSSKRRHWVMVNPGRVKASRQPTQILVLRPRPTPAMGMGLRQLSEKPKALARTLQAATARERCQWCGNSSHPDTHAAVEEEQQRRDAPRPAQAIEMPFRPSSKACTNSSPLGKKNVLHAGWGRWEVKVLRERRSVSAHCR